MSSTSKRNLWLTASSGLAALVGVAAWYGGRHEVSMLAAVVAVAAAVMAVVVSRGASSSQPTAKPSMAAAAQPASRRAPEPSRMLGRFELEREIGRGALSAVYLARDVSTRQPVAIKTLPMRPVDDDDGDDAAEARDRFIREAETARRLQHPDIVTVYEAGENEGFGWIAMEWLQGEDLSSHTSVGSLLPVPEVLRIVARVALAVTYAHGQGVVHRDIKPANVIVDRTKSSVKVADFGVARIADSSRTRTGMVLGTPLFMAPEQMSGARVDGRSDLYAVGVMLFQLLTGHLPFEAATMSALMAQIVNQPAPDIRTWRPELPEALADIVSLALQKRPEMRYADGRQMADDLRAVEASLPHA